MISILKSPVNLFFEFHNSNGWINSLLGRNFACNIKEKSNIYIDLSHHLRAKNKHANDYLDVNELIENIQDLKQITIDNDKIKDYIMKKGVNENWKITLNIDREYFFITKIDIKEGGFCFVVR